MEKKKKKKRVWERKKRPDISLELVVLRVMRFANENPLIKTMQNADK